MWGTSKGISINEVTNQVFSLDEYERIRQQ